ncbi:MAG: hypothetical protein JWR44_2186 [Hymenobacter sp.]|jgi:hypothetical protein|nr:hypothetical protein [Hymenobacter sp.]
MGPLVVLRWGRAAALAATALMTGCEEPHCVHSERTLMLPAPYDQFFGRLKPCGSTPPSPMVASSSNGLTDSFIGSCVSTYRNDSELTTSCETVRTEQRITYDYASLYGFSFVTQVEQFPDGPRLLLRDQSPTSGAPNTELTYQFTSGLARVSYRDAATNTTIIFASPPTVTELTNFQSGGRTYVQVWRITNPLNAAQGRATAATVYYIDRDYGLVRFDQRDGTSWVLMP